MIPPRFRSEMSPDTYGVPTATTRLLHQAVIYMLVPFTFDICEFSKIDFKKVPYISPKKKL